MDARHAQFTGISERLGAVVERYEIRLFKKYLSMVDVPFRESGGKDFVIAVPLRGIVGDPLFVRIGLLARELQDADLGPPFGSWDIKRTYTNAEMRGARLFLLRLPLTHLAAEEYGTQYDESSVCEKCGVGSRQIGQLHIPARKLPKTRDIIRLWGGELIVSERLASLILSNDLSGAALSSIGYSSTRRSLDDCLSNHQLMVNSTPVELTDRVRFGEDPFDILSGGCCLCEAGEIAGARPLTPLTIKESSWDGSDFCHTRVHMSSRGGLFRPYRILMVSKRCFECLRESDIKGFDFEIVDVA